MANLLGKNIGLNYKGILNLGANDNQELSSVGTPVTDGEGTSSLLELSTVDTSLLDENGNKAFSVKANGEVISPNSSKMVNGSAKQLLQSYNHTIYGSVYFGENLDKNKFVALAEEGTVSSFINFKFLGGEINGLPIPPERCGQSINVTTSNNVFSNFGYGVCPANYINFMNSVCQSFGLNTRFIGNEYGFGGDSTYSLICNYDKSENFTLYFGDNVSADISGTGPIQPIVYFLSSFHGHLVTEGFTNVIDTNNINSNEWQGIINSAKSASGGGNPLQTTIYTAP